MSIKKSNKGLKPHKWLKKQIKIIFKWAKYLISMPQCGQRVKYGKKRSKKARRIDNKSKFCFKLPRIDMEMSEVGKNCEKSLKIAQNKPVKR